MTAIDQRKNCVAPSALKNGSGTPLINTRRGRTLLPIVPTEKNTARGLYMLKGRAADLGCFPRAKTPGSGLLPLRGKNPLKSTELTYVEIHVYFRDRTPAPLLTKPGKEAQPCFFVFNPIFLPSRF